MVPNITKGKSISGCMRYVLGQGKGRGNDWEEGQKSRVEWIWGLNFGFPVDDRATADTARRMMEFDVMNASSESKRCKRPCIHVSLSYHPDEKPTREEMVRDFESAAKALGMEEAQWVIVAHNDKDHAHIHAVGSRINPKTGLTFP